MADSQETTSTRRLSVKFWLMLFASSFFVVFILMFSMISVWFWVSTQPAEPSSKESVRFEVKSGEGSSQIAKNLYKANLIKDPIAMMIFLRVFENNHKLQAGSYAMSPGQSVASIVEHMKTGKTDAMTVTILPGRTLSEIKKDLKAYGYSEKEINQAFNATYPSPLLSDKPTGASLEGYVFPETFSVGAGDSLGQLFSRSFDTLYSRMSEDGLIEKLKSKNLNIHQALTLASIVQKEASRPSDQPQIAQVFLLRLGMGMKLESDVTFHYAAEKLGVSPRVNLDSPYNTRIYGGLPPTPISNMNYTALKSIAEPASGDYIYFIAGDDGKIYYAHTLEQHQENIDKHCQKLCGKAF